jgi:hypothetical protein
MKSGGRGMAIGSRSMKLGIRAMAMGARGIKVGFHTACITELNPFINKGSFYKHFHNSGLVSSDTTE